MKKFFGFGSSTPPPPPPPSKPPAPPATKPAPVQKSEAPAPLPPAAPAPAASTATPAPAALIVGRWKDPNSGDVTEFHADGAVTENVAGGEPIRGRYSLTGSKLTINLTGVPDELSFPVAIKTDTLEMTDPEGHVTRYEKVKS